MKDDPREIASYLIQEYGLDGAIAAATREIIAAQEPGAYYGLSIWREVRSVLRARRQGESSPLPSEPQPEQQPKDKPN